MGVKYNSYDDIDMRNQYSKGYTYGFWIGAVSGIVSTFGLCFLVGYYYIS